MAKFKFLRWTSMDDNYLSDNWGKIPATLIAQTLGRSNSAIEARAYRLLGTTLDPLGTNKDSRGQGSEHVQSADSFMDAL